VRCCLPLAPRAAGRSLDGTRAAPARRHIATRSTHGITQGVTRDATVTLQRGTLGCVVSPDTLPGCDNGSARFAVFAMQNADRCFISWRAPQHVVGSGGLHAARLRRRGGLRQLARFGKRQTGSLQRNFCVMHGLVVQHVGHDFRRGDSNASLVLQLPHSNHGILCAGLLPQRQSGALQRCEDRFSRGRGAPMPISTQYHKVAAVNSWCPARDGGSVRLGHGSAKPRAERSDARGVQFSYAKDKLDVPYA
tara:strand:+ start:194 stop:943 length:750 start_codon:yes stop_codon:yes gene_type:complete